MKDEEIMKLLNSIVRVLQCDEDTTVPQCQRMIINVLEEIDAAAFKISGKRIVARETVIEHLCNPRKRNKLKFKI
jgi:hypothetical protein